LEAAQKYWNSRDYDPVQAKYVDGEKERSLSKTANEWAKTKTHTHKLYKG
jgi:hypothetical protein